MPYFVPQVVSMQTIKAIKRRDGYIHRSAPQEYHQIFTAVATVSQVCIIVYIKRGRASRFPGLVRIPIISPVYPALRSLQAPLFWEGLETLTASLVSSC